MSRNAGRGSSSSRRRKRVLQPSVYSGSATTYNDVDNDFNCLICSELINEPYMTTCGHSFCLKCIKQSIDTFKRCPECNTHLDKHQQIFPNFTLHELIQKHRATQENEKRLRLDHQKTSQSLEEVNRVLDQGSTDLASVNYMLDLLWQKKQRMEGDCKAAQNQILKEFLSHVLEKKQAELNQLNEEMALLKTDIPKVQKRLDEFSSENPYSLLSTSHSSTHSEHLANGFDSVLSTSTVDNAGEDGFNGSKDWLYTTLASRRKKMNLHHDDLEQCYFALRKKGVFTAFPDNVKKLTPNGVTSHISKSNTDTTDNAMLGAGAGSVTGLDDFTESLSKFTKFSSIRALANLGYVSDIYSTSSIVSSIEFDKDCDHFAIAGVTKKIKVFEYGNVIRNAVDIHYPIVEMVCNSKISSVVWNSYHSTMLASSDYEGTVTLWDVHKGVKSKIFQEHEKRCWSVDFNKMNPKLLASGSDDAKVKLWCTNMEHSVSSIESKSNICCVKFNPNTSNYLAFGSADHGVHYYDLRQQKEPLIVFKGHRKAVSYTKFLNSKDIVSASTDGQLRVWNIAQSQCVRTFQGHINEKNFVGLSTDGDYIACGSENNSLYVYYKGLSQQLLTYKFDHVKTALEKERKEEDPYDFVSAVSWRPGSNVLVAANSQGIIKVLELV